MRLFTWNNAQQVVKDLYETLSNRASKLSSKRLERLVFTLTAVSLVVACFIYLYTHDQLTATETVILITPLMIAGGYNLSKGQQEKKDEGV